MVVVPGFGAIAPTTAVTIEFWQKVNAARQQVTLALGPDNSSNLMSINSPWEDGSVYWRFGDPAVGQLTYTPPELLAGA